MSRRKARREYHGDLRYLRFCEDYRGNPKGTVSRQRRMVPGYPHIGRIFRLEQGLVRQFADPFRVEERENGYRVLELCKEAPKRIGLFPKLFGGAAIVD